nr:hypothetical protein BaRGS_006561 [Batillaria attramentaria]
MKTTPTPTSIRVRASSRVDMATPPDDVDSRRHFDICLSFTTVTTVAMETPMIAPIVLVLRRVCERSGLTTQRQRSQAMTVDKKLET